MPRIPSVCFLRNGQMSVRARGRKMALSRWRQHGSTLPSDSQQSITFPTAQGSIVVRHLGPELDSAGFKLWPSRCGPETRTSYKELGM